MKDSFSKKISVLVFLLSLCFSALSQDGNPLQFLFNVSQSSRLNPSYQNKTEKLVVGFPVIAGTILNWESNFGIKNLAADNFTIDFYKTLREPGSAFFTTHVPMLFLSFKTKSSTYGFSISENMVGLTNFDEEIINFLGQGLQPYYGKNEQIGPLSISTHYYREIAFSYATEIVTNFHIGIRPKLLFSKFYYNMKNVVFDVETMSDSETLTINPTMSFTATGPFKIVRNEETEFEALKTDFKPGDYFFGFRNIGAGIDLGITYHPTKESEISISVLDLGFTRLKHKSYTIEYSKSLYYKKENLYQSSNPEAPKYWSPAEALTAFSDSIPFISTVTKNSTGTLEQLPIQINATFKYRLPSQIQLGFSNHFTYYLQQTENFLSGFIHSKITSKLELAGTLNFYNFERIFPGIGASYTGESVQYFISTNNLLELVQATKAKNLNLCFGVNFLFSTD